MTLTRVWYVIFIEEQTTISKIKSTKRNNEWFTKHNTKN